jgi:hypothetical protein
MRRSAELKACTATYRATGPLDQTVRFIYLAPDRARFDARGTSNGIASESTIWVLGNRCVFRSIHGNERLSADVPFCDPSLEADFEAVHSALRSSFPSPKSGEGLPALGPGVSLELWIDFDQSSTGHGSLRGSASWSRDRAWILEWLMRVSALPVLRDEGERIVAEDPRTKAVVTLSKTTGFIESIRGQDALSVELTNWAPSVEEAEFSIPASEPNAHDLSEEYVRLVSASYLHHIEAEITSTALEALQRESITDEEFTKRLASVYDLLNRRLRRDEFARLRDSMKKMSDESVDRYRRQRTASASDPDLRSICDQGIAEQRLTFVNKLRRVTEVALDPDTSPQPPDASTDPRAAKLVADARRESMATTLEAEVTQPALEYFDEQVLAVQATK